MPHSHMIVNIFHAAFGGRADKPVFSYVDTVSTNRPAACDRAFHMFNAPEEFLNEEDKPIAAAYRLGKLRSLSVEDIVEVDDPRCHRPAKWVCAPVGWKRVTADSHPFA